MLLFWFSIDTYNIHSVNGAVGKFCLSKHYYRIGEDVLGTFDFQNSPIPCVKVSCITCFLILITWKFLFSKSLKLFVKAKYTMKIEFVIIILLLRSKYCKHNKNEMTGFSKQKILANTKLFLSCNQVKYSPFFYREVYKLTLTQFCY